MKIDLQVYSNELKFWVEAFEPFIDRVSWSRLTEAFRALEDDIDNRRPTVVWKLPVALRTKTADRYDGLDKSKHEVAVTWQFTSRFSLGGDRKRPIWTIEEMVTQVQVLSVPDDQPILHFHFDMKELRADNRPQLGPHIHMQFSEHYLKDKGRIPIAVPRFPSAVMLPTDCLDLVLSEFFPGEWPKSQTNVTGIDTLRTRQRERMSVIAIALSKKWDESKKQTPVSATQHCYMPDLQIV